MAQPRGALLFLSMIAAAVLVAALAAWVVADTVYLQTLSTLSVQANLYAYHIAMTTLGIAGFMLCYVSYRVKLVPRWLAGWGIVGYVTILGGSVLEVLGYPLTSMHTIPGGLWEVFIGVWLIVKGFNPSAFASQATTATRPGTSAAPLVKIVPNVDPARA